VANGEVAKEESIDEREDRGVSADAEGKRQNGNGGEPGTLAQDAKRVTQGLQSADGVPSSRSKVWSRTQE
jgi:hypothetical protein